MTTIRDTNFNPLKSAFYGKASNILIYKTDKKKKMPQDPKTIDRYRDEVIEKYNAMAALARVIYDGLEQKEKDKLTQSFEKFYKPRLVNALNFIGFRVDLPANFEIINIADVGTLPDEGAIGADNDDDLDFIESESFKEAMQLRMQSNDDVLQQNDEKLHESNQNDNANGVKSSVKSQRVFTNSKFRDMNPVDFDNMFSLEPDRIAANRGRGSNFPNSNRFPNANERFKPNLHSNFNSNSRPNTNFNSNSRPNTNFHSNSRPNANFDSNYRDTSNFNRNFYPDLPQSHENNNEYDDNDYRISDINFYNLCARTFRETYSGDPLALKPFINQINMVHRMCQHEGHEAILKDFIMAHVKGIAADILPAEPESIDAIKTTLLAKIKPENSKVVKGKLMALKADRNNLTEYAKKAEQLAENLKRSLILENIPYENANKMVIDDTIDLCRANTNSVLVKAGLIVLKVKQ